MEKEKIGVTRELGNLFSKYWDGQLPVFHFTPFSLEKNGKFISTGNRESFLNNGARKNTDFHCLAEEMSGKNERLKIKPIHFLQSLNQMRYKRALKHGKIKWMKILEHEGVTNTIPGAILMDGNNPNLRRSRQKNANGTHYICTENLPASDIFGEFTFEVDYTLKKRIRVKDMPPEERFIYLSRIRKMEQEFKKKVVSTMVGVVFEKFLEKKKLGKIDYLEDLPIFEKYKLLTSEQVSQLIE